MSGGGPLFGLIPAGLPLITDPTSAPSPTSLLYALPSSRSFSHITLFLLPGVSLPPGTAAAIYLASASAPQSFKFLGAIGPGKESAVFKVGGGGGGDGLVVGVSVEPEADVARKMQELGAEKSATAGSTQQQQQQPPTAVLAQRIIQNAFNFLTGFSGTAGPGGVEVVPLKAFEEWWRKFENRVRNDPSFLERQSD
ncbi:hypothetical protein ISF_07600 [Cordyceps fumosorosea ARSEF 2679]|uniref:Uncharacterized protein n=1 Tax=Cordyceps fumosorosea (strain ARSEF 2679) TaxID=1081104 RepID=A0A167NW17_CORFA|nr:hypothetical protein ISF_07600 [Cordyceps fumosorosea ARSEF 2679]OAA56002.1 hypothetical protein ISF_07600 [Cordyceps fumosorosea ARSEF 2679]